MKKKPSLSRAGGLHTDNPLQKARIDAGLTQKAAAEEINCGIRTLQRYESGLRTPNVTIMLYKRNISRPNAARIFKRYKYLMSYRRGMIVSEVMIFPYFSDSQTGYYVCPRCHVTLEREFMSYCDRCGQKLDWRFYKQAKKIYPLSACKNQIKQSFDFDT